MRLPSLCHLPRRQRTTARALAAVGTVLARTAGPSLARTFTTAMPSTEAQRLHKALRRVSINDRLQSRRTSPFRVKRPCSMFILVSPMFVAFDSLFARASRPRYVNTRSPSKTLGGGGGGQGKGRTKALKQNFDGNGDKS